MDSAPMPAAAAIRTVGMEVRGNETTKCRKSTNVCLTGVVQWIPESFPIRLARETGDLRAVALLSRTQTTNRSDNE